MISYDGKIFQAIPGDTGNSVRGEPIGYYHQDGDVVWAEFAGGDVVTGRLVGRCTFDGTLTLAYCQLMRDGDVVTGLCHSSPELLEDGRVRLREQWQRFGESAGTGVSYLEEVD